jgi:hypothetical protein
MLVELRGVRVVKTVAEQQLVKTVTDWDGVYCSDTVVIGRIWGVELLQLVRVRKTKSAVNLNAHQDGRRSSTGISEILETEASIV